MVVPTTYSVFTQTHIVSNIFQVAQIDNMKWPTLQLGQLGKFEKYLT